MIAVVILSWGRNRLGLVTIMCTAFSSISVDLTCDISLSTVLNVLRLVYETLASHFRKIGATCAASDLEDSAVKLYRSLKDKHMRCQLNIPTVHDCQCPVWIIWKY